MVTFTKNRNPVRKLVAECNVGDINIIMFAFLIASFCGIFF